MVPDASELPFGTDIEISILAGFSDAAELSWAGSELLSKQGSLALLNYFLSNGSEPSLKFSSELGFFSLIEFSI